MIGPGLSLTQSVHFTVAAAEVCRIGFTVLGRRSVVADDPADRAGVGAASRHLGATLPVWASLAPDAHALVGWAADQRQLTLESSAFADLRSELESSRLALVTEGFLVTLSAVLADMVAAAGPADGRLVTGLRIVEVHLSDARCSLRPESIGPPPGAGEAERVSTALLAVLAKAPKTFSSPLTVPKSLAENHPRW